MSTKIYNAYKFNGTIKELMEHLKEYKPKWIEHKISQICSCMAQEVSKYSDHGYMQILNIIQEQTHKKHNSYFDYFDLKGSATVMFHGRSIYVIFFMDDFGTPPEIIDDRFEDFHYQNQSDPYYAYQRDDGKIDDKTYNKLHRNWKRRELVWDEILGDKSTCSEVGLTFEFNSLYDEYAVAMKIAEWWKDIVENSKKMERK